MDGQGENGIEGLDPRLTDEAIKNTWKDPSPLLADITLEETPRGFEIFYSDRLANEHRELVDQSADWLENEMGVLNLGQIDYKILMADGRLTDEIRNGLTAWWALRIDDLNLG